MRSYLKVFIWTSSCLLAAILIVNASIDPYEFLGTPRIEGFNAVKPFFGEHATLGKSFVLWRRQPNAVVLGSSRENHGIDPDHPAWFAPNGVRYNLGKDGAHIVEVEQLFEHALIVGDVKQAVIGLDFLRMFDGKLIEVEELDPSLLASADHSSFLAALNVGRYLASWSMLTDSFDTWRNQDPALIDFEANGRHNNLTFERNVRRAGGQRSAFQRAELTQYLGPRLALPKAQRFSVLDSADRPAMEHLGRVLDLAARNNVDVRLVIAPVHARLLEAYRLMDLWPEFEEWKRAVVQTANGKWLRATDRRFPVWDFNDYTRLTSEELPPAGDAEARMRWFWEDTHYRKELGDHVLDRIFDYSSAEREVPEDFGKLLNDEDLDAYFAAVRKRGHHYRESHPTDLAELEAAKARALRCAAGTETCPSFARLPRLAPREAAMRKTS